MKKLVEVLILVDGKRRYIIGNDVDKKKVNNIIKKMVEDIKMLLVS